jgi:hypothetical protein
LSANPLVAKNSVTSRIEGESLGIDAQLARCCRSNHWFRSDARKRIWEIKVDSILKLDRAEKSAPEDSEPGDVSNEEVAA